MPKILVVGSLAFDVIFEVHGKIKNEIPLTNGKINNINLMFTARNKKVYFGGTGGNIAYGLGLLKENPLLFSLVGKDFDDYKVHLEKNGIIIKSVQKEDEYTATFYGISDEDKEQIGIWQPNAYGDWIEKVSLSDTISQDELKEIEVAIFSPGTGISTTKMLREFRNTNKSATVIFDPSQVLSIFYDKKLLLECLSYCNIFVGNEIEVAQLQTIFDLTIKDLLGMGLDSVIETKGEMGLTIYKDAKASSSNKDTFLRHNENVIAIDIKSFKPERVLETTGAGDAFRSGLIYGLIQNKDLETACRIGTYMGAKSVEEFSGQGYQIDMDKVKNILFED